mmetsp:Transcript_23948/g.49259  ORF Transcript_23948/g.49259 Transcript_23948/m.49259 type:complete len:569 (+) Transcript_23948:42-1748(+)
MRLPNKENTTVARRIKPTPTTPRMSKKKDRRGAGGCAWMPIIAWSALSLLAVSAPLAFAFTTTPASTPAFSSTLTLAAAAAASKQRTMPPRSSVTSRSALPGDNDESDNNSNREWTPNDLFDNIKNFFKMNDSGSKNDDSSSLPFFSPTSQFFRPDQNYGNDDRDNDDDDDELPAGTSLLLKIPAKQMKPGGLRLFLMFYLMGMQNTPDRNTWRADQKLMEVNVTPKNLPEGLLVFDDDDDEQQQDGNGDRDGDDREEERPNRRGAHQERGIASTTAAAASSSPTISLLASGLALALLALSLRSSPIGSGGRDRRRRGRDRHWKHQQEQESSEKTYDANNNDDNDSDNDNDNGIPNLPRDNVVSTTSSSIADQPIATAGAANDSINRYRDRNCNRTDSTTSSTKEDVPSIITIASANTYPSMDNSDSKLKSQNNKSNSNGNGNNNNNNNKSNNILSRIHLLRQKQKRRRKPKPKLLWVEEVSYASTIELEELSSTLLSVEKTKTKEKRKQAAANTKKTTSIATSSTKRPTATPAATNKRNTKKVGGRRILRLRSVEETYSTPDHIHVS